MTAKSPKEKAEELFKSYNNVIKNGRWDASKEAKAKQCALLAVEAVLQQLALFRDLNDEHKLPAEAYWGWVKKELELL